MVDVGTELLCQDTGRVSDRASLQQMLGLLLTLQAELVRCMYFAKCGCSIMQHCSLPAWLARLRAHKHVVTICRWQF